MFDDLVNKAKDMAEEAIAGSDMLQNAIATAKAKAADLGISTEVFDELVSKAKEMMADGSISKEEVIAEVKKLAEEKGVSSEIIDKVLGFLQ
jgi:mevalonate kinase